MADGIEEQAGGAAAQAANLDRALTAEAVRTLAAAAGLPLAPGREAALLPILRAWLSGGLLLNASMQDEACRDLLPVTLFRHCRTDPGSP